MWGERVYMYTDARVQLYACTCENRNPQTCVYIYIYTPLSSEHNSKPWFSELRAQNSRFRAQSSEEFRDRVVSQLK